LTQNFGIHGQFIIQIFMSNVLILGIDGMLGNMLSEVFSSKSSDNLTFTSRKNNLDSRPLNGEVLSFDAHSDVFNTLAQKTRPDYVINCIGAIKPLIIEDDKNSIKNAYLVNSYLPLSISKSAVELGFQYLQIGTDCVFSGSKGGYTEKSKLDALDVYGKSKIVGEFLTSNKSVVRSSIIGPEKGEGKSLLNWFYNEHSSEINGFNNHLWNGVTTLNFSKIVHGIVEGKHDVGLIQHLIPSDVVTKYELLNMFSKHFKKTIKINKIDAENVIDRTLNTVDSNKNDILWKLGGYTEVQTIEENIIELSNYHYSKELLGQS